MDPRDENTLTVAEILDEIAALSHAALAKDFDEARFRTKLVEDKALAANLPKVAAAATHVIERLGPPGTEPDAGYGEAIYRVASALDGIRF